VLYQPVFYTKRFQHRLRLMTHGQASLFSCYPHILVLFPRVTFKVARE
jgi:hypothetical protein